MVTRKLMRATICNRVSHPVLTIDELPDFCAALVVTVFVKTSWLVDLRSDVLIGVLTTELAGIGMDKPLGMGIILVVACAVIALEFAVSLSYAGDVLVGARVDELTTV